MRWSVFFYLSSKQNRKFKYRVQTKPMGENTIVSVAVVLALKKVNKTFTNHSARKTTVSKLKKAKIVEYNAKCHRPHV